jgi:glycosyltransferase involved in cell wall biosynthesis
VSLLTAGRDKPYALGLAAALLQRGIAFEFIGSDELDARELNDTSLIRVYNLRGDQTAEAPLFRKAFRVLTYYCRLLAYAARTRSELLHILWNNKFELFDRTVLMLYYRSLGKKVILTVHNVNAAKRDRVDSLLNRLSLKIQYRLTDHIFVHTEKMRAELQEDFGVPSSRISLIPFGINNTLPKSTLQAAGAKQRMGVDPTHRTILFFGNIAPYKGLEYLVHSIGILSQERTNYRLIVAGRPKGSDSYWQEIRSDIARLGLRENIIERIEYIPDEEVEVYFKAADVLVLPYTHIFQSGVLFLGYSFGLPVVAADVGSLAEDIVEGRTGFLFSPRDATDLARALRVYFESPLFREISIRRRDIETYANERYSWNKVGEITEDVYRKLLGRETFHGPPACPTAAE